MDKDIEKELIKQLIAIKGYTASIATTLKEIKASINTQIKTLTSIEQALLFKS